MLRHYLLTIVYIIVSGTAYGQMHGRIFLNHQKDPCQESDAVYSRIVVKDTEDANKYLIQDYHKDGSIQAIFQVSSEEMIIDWRQYKQLAFRKKIQRNGYYRIWYPNGQLKFEAHYQNNKSCSAPKYWLANGEVAFAPIHFKLDEPAKFPGRITEYLVSKVDQIEGCNTGNCRKLFVDISINKEGKVCYAEAQNSVDPEVDAKILEALVEMPDWKPAKMGGHKINTICTLPVCF